MKKLRNWLLLLICTAMLTTVLPHLQAYSDEANVNNDNLAKVQAFIDSGKIYDIGLYSTTELAVRMIGRQDSNFVELCEDPDTLASLALLISEEDDEFLEYLMNAWYSYLIAQSNTPVALTVDSDYINYTLTLPGGKPVAAQLYTGSSVPGTYTYIEDYPNASLIYSSSYYYNCHSYAWYLHGDINSHYPQLCFDNGKDFRTSPTCADEVTTPKVGDIVVYTDNDAFHEKGPELHSAIVTSVSSGTSYDQITVKSKWGVYGVYSHKLSECPYYTNRTEGNTTYKTKITYYRLTHQYILDGNYYYCKGCGYKNPTMVTGVTE